MAVTLARHIVAGGDPADGPIGCGRRSTEQRTF